MNAVPAVITETLLTIAEAATMFPAVGGKPCNPKTVYKWIDQGVKVGGVRVKLEAGRVGGRRVTSAEAIERFLVATAGDGPEQPAPRSPTARRKASEAAGEYLRREFALANKK